MKSWYQKLNLIAFTLRRRPRNFNAMSYDDKATQDQGTEANEIQFVDSI